MVRKEMKRTGQRRRKRILKSLNPESEASKLEVAIIGYGFVGKATEFLLDTFYPGTGIQIHDPDQGHEIEDWSGIQYVFVCVPTNLKGDKLDISIIDKVLNELSSRSCAHTVIPIIRSTVGPEQAIDLTKKYGCVIMPEFLREQHWKKDVIDPEIPILVGCYNCNKFIDFISKTNQAGKKVITTTPGNAATIKLFRNAALAVNVGLANDIKGICDVYDLDYKDVKDFFMNDKTLGNHWEVPGPDGKEGFGGTCLPKDLTHASSLCYNRNNIMKVALEANKTRRNDE